MEGDATNSPAAERPSYEALTALLRECMAIDARRLSGRLRGMRGKNPSDAEITRVEEAIRASCARAAARREALPRPTFSDALPVVQRKAEIAAAIERNQVIVLCGETGSGKTTQLPKILLELGRGVRGVIGHTQPRRVAARSVAARIAEELGVTLGGAVGFKMRFTDATSGQTYVKLMTDGILLAETQNDPLLDQYDALIIDEAHERSLNIDFLLGYVHRLLPRRPDLKVIITSATIDPQRFAKHFSIGGKPAEIIEVSGRT